MAVTYTNPKDGWYYLCRNHQFPALWFVPADDFKGRRPDRCDVTCKECGRVMEPVWRGMKTSDRRPVA